MPLGNQCKCSACGTEITPIWSKTDGGDVICHVCKSIPPSEKFSPVVITEESSKGVEQEINVNKPETQRVINENHSSMSSSSKKESTVTNNQKKTSKGRQLRPRNNNSSKSVAGKGKGRRIIFKKSATKAPSSVATPVTCNSVYYEGSYYQVGDIVSLTDIDGGTYYAQIKGLLQDQYCQKSAAITWLLPTLASPENSFDPSTYIIGPEEDIPRKLDCMSFVCHAPSDYFKNMSSPYTTISAKPDASFIWTRIGPQVKGFSEYSDETHS